MNAASLHTTSGGARGASLRRLPCRQMSCWAWQGLRWGKGSLGLLSHAWGDLPTLGTARVQDVPFAGAELGNTCRHGALRSGPVPITEAAGSLALPEPGSDHRTEGGCAVLPDG